MDDDRKYKQRGYMDTDRESRDRRPLDKPKPSGPRPPIDVTGPRLPRLLQNVVAARCFNCSTALQSDVDWKGKCPKCGVAMEPIEIGVEGLPLRHVRLCPRCYLVTWSDQYGLHSRQGVPMKKGFDPGIAPSQLTGEPDEC